jgi:hypothetical protein
MVRGELEDAAVRRSRLKIATDVVGITGSSVQRRPPGRLESEKQRPFAPIRRSGYPEIGVGPCPVESATGSTEKMPHPGGVVMSGIIPRSVGHDPAAPGIRRAISTSYSRPTRLVKL